MTLYNRSFTYKRDILNKHYQYDWVCISCVSPCSIGGDKSLDEGVLTLTSK